MPRCKSLLTSWVIILLAALITSGCVYIPPIGRQFTEEKRTQIVAGATTKAEVLKLLGKPELLEDEGFFVYEANRSYGLLVFIAAAPGGGIFPVPINLEHFLVLLEFDDQNVVRRYELEAAEERLYEGAIPKHKGAGSESFQRQRLLTGRAKDILGFDVGIGFTSVAFSPDGRMLAAGGIKLVGGASSSNRVWLVDLSTDQRRTLDTRSYQRVSFSPDGTRLALLGGTITLIDVNTGKELLEFTGHGKPSFWTWTPRGSTSLAFDPEGSVVATGGHSGYVKLWHSRTGNEIQSFRAHRGPVFSIAYSPDGQVLATAGDDAVSLWEAATGKELGTLSGKTGLVRFSPNGGMLAIHRGSHVELWQVDPRKGAPPAALAMQLVDVFLLPYFRPNWPIDLSLDFSRDGNLLAASNGGMVVYDIRNGRRTLRVTPMGQTLHAESLNDAVRALAFSADGQLLATGTNEGLYLWRVPVEGDAAKQN